MIRLGLQPQPPAQVISPPSQAHGIRHSPTFWGGRGSACCHKTGIMRSASIWAGSDLLQLGLGVAVVPSSSLTLVTCRQGLALALLE